MCCVYPSHTTHTLHTNCMTIIPTCAVLFFDNAISNNAHTNVERTLIIHFRLIIILCVGKRKKKILKRKKLASWVLVPNL